MNLIVHRKNNKSVNVPISPLSALPNLTYVLLYIVKKLILFFEGKTNKQLVLSLTKIYTRYRNVVLF